MKKDKPNMKSTKNPKAALSRKQLLEILTEVYSQLEDVEQKFEVYQKDTKYVIELNNVTLIYGMVGSC